MLHLSYNSPMIKEHWRKTAKTCPSCLKLKSKNHFIQEIENCASCAYDEAAFKLYKQCVYCKRYLKKELFNEKCLCNECRIIYNKRHHEFKSKGKLKKASKHICTSCGKEKGCRAFPRGSNAIDDNLKCRLCVSNQLLFEEGKKRCNACGSAFIKHEIIWNKWCKRCHEKNARWTLERNRKWRKTDEGKAFHRDYSRYYYWNVYKINYNKLLNLQYLHGIARKRKVNRNGYWYVLNTSLYKEFKSNFQKQFQFTSRVIEFLRTGKGRIEGDKVILDKPTKEFMDYIDSEEGMSASKKPQWESKKIPVNEYFCDV